MHAWALLASLTLKNVNFLHFLSWTNFSEKLNINPDDFFRNVKICLETVIRIVQEDLSLFSFDSGNFMFEHSGILKTLSFFIRFCTHDFGPVFYPFHPIYDFYIKWRLVNFQRKMSLVNFLLIFAKVIVKRYLLKNSFLLIKQTKKMNLLYYLITYLKVKMSAVMKIFAGLSWKLKFWNDHSVQHNYRYLMMSCFFFYTEELIQARISFPMVFVNRNKHLNVKTCTSTYSHIFLTKCTSHILFRCCNCTLET